MMIAMLPKTTLHRNKETRDNQDMTCRQKPRVPLWFLLTRAYGLPGSSLGLSVMIKVVDEGRNYLI